MLTTEEMSHRGDGLMAIGMLFGHLLWTLLALVLIILGVMAIIILYRRYFAKK